MCPPPHLQGHLWSNKTSKDEHGEEDHGAAEAGGVQPPGQRSRSDASAPPLLRAVPPSSPHDPKGAGGEAVHDASSLQQGEWDPDLNPDDDLILLPVKNMGKTRQTSCSKYYYQIVDFGAPGQLPSLICLVNKVSRAVD